MPKVAVVDGVKIMFYANEHPPAPFHAKFGEYQAVIEIEPLRLVRGSLPPAKERSVLTWAASRKKQLALAFVTSVAHEEVKSIE